MLEVGCPEPAPVLARMLSTRSCCASARHCSTPTVSPLICCVTSYLLCGTAVLSEADSIFYYPACVVQKRNARPRGYPALSLGISSPGLRAGRELRRRPWVGETKTAPATAAAA